VVAGDGLRQRCLAILASACGPRLRSRGVGLEGGARLLRRFRPHVLLLDAVESPLRALGMLPALRRLSPATGIILLGGNRTPTAVVLEGLRRGASGHLAEREIARQLPKAVHMVAIRQSWLPRALGAALVAELRAAAQRSNGHRPARLRLVRGGARPTR
jgi:DNA-binding NarL/FixJ family response regulator